MSKKTKIIISVVIVLALVVLWAAQEKGVTPFGSSGVIEGTPYYMATAASNTLVTGESAVLHRIVIGTTIADSSISITDADTGTGEDSIVWHASANDLKGVWDVGIYFTSGIIVSSSRQSDVTFIFSPR